VSRQEKGAFTASITLPIEVVFPHPTGGRSEFYFVRHGRTEGNVRRILVGRTDIPLDELGYRQASAVADHVSSLPRPDVIVASPLLRARQTAHAIAERLALPVEVDPDIAELNFGEYEGWSFDDIQAHRPEFAEKFSDLEFDTHWPGGERLSEFHLRVRSALDNLAKRYASHRAVVVSHGGFLGSLAAQLFGTPPNDWSRYQIQNCSVTHLEIAAERTIFHRFNDCAHLEAVNMEPAR
jgi:broad specificity phosphatase PhoE